MGKDDAETIALKKELEDLINRCKVVLEKYFLIKIEKILISYLDIN